MNRTYDIAIIGAGPAGIASAVEANILGVEKIVILEKGENHSMTIRKFYKDNKRVDKDWQGQKIDLHGNVIFMDGTKESTLDLFNTLIDEHRLDAKFKTEIDSIEQKDGFFIIKTTGLEYLKARNVIIAIGSMGKPNKPSYSIPSALKSICNHNLEKCNGNEKILVVGGGDSAAEYAYYLADSNDVTLTYRRDKFTRLNPENLRIINDYTAKGHLELRLGVDITSLEAVECRAKVNFTDGKSKFYDRIIYAIGGASPKDFLMRCGVPLNERGYPECDEHFATSISGLYVAGDVAVRIGGSIGASLNHAYTILTHLKKSDRI